jgi:hypothetical protein
MKAKLASAFGSRRTPSIEADVTEQLQGFVRYIRGKCLITDVELRPMDFATAANHFTLDSIMKQVPPKGDTFEVVYPPGGTRVGHNTLAAQRLPEVFGADKGVFSPERWLGFDSDRRYSAVNAVELAFDSGRWGCAWKPVEFMELNTVFVEVSACRSLSLAELELTYATLSLASSAF